MKIKVSPTVWIMAAALMLSEASQIKNIAVILLAALLHEAGHLVAAAIMKIPVKCIQIDIFGAYIRTDHPSCSYIKEAVLCLAGPVANIFSAAFLPQLLSIDDPLFTISSAALAVINLLPIKSFDGGRALSCIMLRFLPPDAVSAVTDILSFVCIFILWSISVYFIMRVGAYLSLFVFSAALFAKMFLPYASR